MNLIFCHQNIPSQFKHLALARHPANRVVVLMKRENPVLLNVQTVVYGLRCEVNNAISAATRPLQTRTGARSFTRRWGVL